MKLVDFIIPTFNRPNELKSTLSALIAQTSPNWEANVVIDNSYDLELLGLVNSFKDSRIKATFAGQRYNNWGHTPREIGKQVSLAEYVIMTGDDNYYTPNFVAELEKVAVHKPGIIYWDMVHSHYHYQYFKCSLGFNQIDMGAFATRTDLAKQIKLNTTYAADGEFVEEYKKKFPFESVIKIEKVLFVHN